MGMGLMGAFLSEMKMGAFLSEMEPFYHQLQTEQLHDPLDNLLRGQEY